MVMEVITEGLDMGNNIAHALRCEVSGEENCVVVSQSLNTTPW